MENQNRANLGRLDLPGSPSEREFTTLGPAILIVRGIPGSGKSFFSNKLLEIIGKDNSVLLDPDTIDKQNDEYKDLSERLLKEGVDPKFHPYRFLIAKARNGIVSGKILIWNQPFTDLQGIIRTVNRLTDIAMQNDHALLKVLIAEVEVDPETARSRILERQKKGGHGLSEEVFLDFLKRYQKASGLGYRTMTVNGLDEVEKSAMAVLDILKTLS